LGRGALVGYGCAPVARCSLHKRPSLIVFGALLPLGRSLGDFGALPKYGFRSRQTVLSRRPACAHHYGALAATARSCATALSLCGNGALDVPGRSRTSALSGRPASRSSLTALSCASARALDWRRSLGARLLAPAGRCSHLARPFARAPRRSL